ncbi:hypothetical protein G7Y89_g12273 [Cudoniella acicularis]|uniref:Uncharacterized protein n=1 Tax=Cudoniella acicularis TaxID=354080 RepID=A0A8H4VZT8_9HELO|nr:hypothetical protein G7Y89_g12273 [Cudoniella acicularis]
METADSQPFLPPELLLHVIQCLVPPSAHSAIALPAAHPTTKALLCLTLTSCLTNTLARRLLYEYCLYLDTTERVKAFDRTIQSLASKPNPTNYNITSLYISLSAPNNSNGNKIPSIALVARVLDSLHQTLKHLLLDFPIRIFFHPNMDGMSVDPDGYLGPIRKAFHKLNSLETYCFLYEAFISLFYPEIVDFDDVNLDTASIAARITTNTSTPWPDLKVLALYNPYFGETSTILREISKLQSLETLIVARPDGLERINIEDVWRAGCGNKKRELNIVIVNTEKWHRIDAREYQKEGNWVRIRVLNVPTSYYGDEDENELCVSWVRRKMLRGEPPKEWS